MPRAVVPVGKPFPKQRSLSVHANTTHYPRNRHFLFTVGYVFTSYSEIDIVEGRWGMKRRSQWSGGKTGRGGRTR
jgi:hypothetical protein